MCLFRRRLQSGVDSRVVSDIFSPGESDVSRSSRVLIVGVIGISLHGHATVNTFACCTLSRRREVRSAADGFRLISDEARQPAVNINLYQFTFYNLV